MSVIRRHAITSIVIRRLRDISGTDRSSLHATATADVPLQTLSREAASALGIGLDEKALVAWLEIDGEIKEGDHITVSDSTSSYNGRTFKVIELIERDYGINQHLEAVLTEYNE